jgi:hypothetical protein
MESNTLPVYNEKDTTPTNPNPAPCQIHGPSETPLLSAQAASPQTRVHLQSLSTALAAATEEGACLQCTSKTISQTLTAFLQEMRTAKKDGRWSHEEKRALRGEVKGLLKEMKHDVKESWKRNEGCAGRPARRGFYWKR